MSRRLAELTEGLIEAVGLKPRSTSDRARRIREAAKAVAEDRMGLCEAVERVGYRVPSFYDNFEMSDAAETLHRGFIDIRREAGR